MLRFRRCHFDFTLMMPLFHDAAALRHAITAMPLLLLDTLDT